MSDDGRPSKRQKKAAAKELKELIPATEVDVEVRLYEMSKSFLTMEVRPSPCFRCRPSEWLPGGPRFVSPKTGLRPQRALPPTSPGGKVIAPEDTGSFRPDLRWCFFLVISYGKSEKSTSLPRRAVIDWMLKPVSD